MDIERERGITIKSQTVRLPFTAADDRTYVLNLIDTPGRRLHLRGIPQSRRLRGAVLLVDAAQGIEAQTLANLWLAMEHDLVIIPVLNKIDLPAAQPEKYAAELAHIIGCSPSDVLRQREDRRRGRGSAQRGRGPDPRPKGRPGRCCPRTDLRLGLRHVPRRGHLRAGGRRGAACQERIQMMFSGTTHELLEVGVISPSLFPRTPSPPVRWVISSPASRTCASHESVTP